MALWLEGMPPVLHRRVEKTSLMPALRLVSNTMSALANWAVKRLRNAETNTAFLNMEVMISALWFSITRISVIIAILVKPSLALPEVSTWPHNVRSYKTACSIADFVRIWSYGIPKANVRNWPR